MSGRDSLTLSKLFEEMVQYFVEYDQLLIKPREAMNIKLTKVIDGLKY